MAVAGGWSAEVVTALALAVSHYYRRAARHRPHDGCRHTDIRNVDLEQWHNGLDGCPCLLPDPAKLSDIRLAVSVLLSDPLAMVTP